MPQNLDFKYWIAYSKIPKIGPISFKQVYSYFKSMEKAWRATKDELICAKIPPRLVDEIISARKDIDPDEELEKLNKSDVKVVTYNEEAYPPALKQIPTSPMVIYYRGSLEFLRGPCLAVVGTRKFSTYGRQVTEEIVSHLSRKGITIVSGLALGIDSIAHKACLDAGGKTVAVLGSGVNKECVSPITNLHIAERILESGGAILSEYPIGIQAAPFTFPMRNRIVAGLCRGVLVIESPQRSGTLITARHALEYNRDIFAIPGSIYAPGCMGTNQLIKNGAIPVTCPEDILYEYNLEPEKKAPQQEMQFDTQHEKIVLEVLSKEPTNIDKIAHFSKLKINDLLSTLSILEIKGLIKDLGGKNYIVK